MLSIENLSVSVDAKPILQGLTLDVPAGEVHAIMGPNGAGKSTLSYALAGKPGYAVTGGSASLDGAGYAFERAEVPLHLIGLGDDRALALASRADARRVAARLGSFGRAELDFGGIAEIGQGFADELFRVLPRQQPGLQLVPVGMSAQVSAMANSIAP